MLSRLTIKASIAFFVIGFGLYLGHIYTRKQATASADVLAHRAGLDAPATPAAPDVPATPAPVAP